MKHKDVIDLIRGTAKIVGVDPDLAVAIGDKETNLDPDKTRYEAQWKYLYLPGVYAERLGISVATERVLQSISWGCMQVMGSVARELGYQGQLTLLVKPELGILFGVRKLKELSEKYQLEADVIASYNQGSSRKDSKGQYQNAPYVEDVMDRLKRLRAIGGVVE